MAKDVAEILGYGKAETMTRRLDDDEKDTTICSTPGGPQEVTVINESGLYHALLGSEQPKAIAFRKWVTGEVLPSLRKHEVFEHQEFGQIRIVYQNGEPWFVANDIAEALGYLNTRDAIRNHCRYVAKHDAPHPQSPSKTIEINIIPESDVYRLIMRSNLPAAERFQDWVVEEVLPSLRKHEVFEHQEFWQIRIVEINGEPWFVAKDVATALGYTDTDKAIRNHCKYSKLFKPADLSGLEIGPRGYDLDLP